MRPLTNDQRRALYQTLSLLEVVKNELYEKSYYSQENKVYGRLEETFETIESIIDYDLSLGSKSAKERLFYETLSRLYN